MICGFDSRRLHNEVESLPRTLPGRDGLTEKLSQAAALPRWPGSLQSRPYRTQRFRGGWCDRDTGTEHGCGRLAQRPGLLNPPQFQKAVGPREPRSCQERTPWIEHTFRQRGRPGQQRLTLSGPPKSTEAHPPHFERRNAHLRKLPNASRIR